MELSEFWGLAPRWFHICDMSLNPYGPTFSELVEANEEEQVVAHPMGDEVALKATAERGNDLQLDLKIQVVLVIMGDWFIGVGVGWAARGLGISRVLVMQSGLSRSPCCWPRRLGPGLNITTVLQRGIGK
eukprot:9498708-Pyramimonas_sp.AAC.1